MVYAVKTEDGKTVRLTNLYRKSSSKSTNYFIVSEVYEIPIVTNLERRTELAYRLENDIHK